MPPVPLALLPRASRSFDRQRLDGLEAASWPRLTPARSLLFGRRLGTSRQGVQELVAGLVRQDLLAVQDDPARHGGRLSVLATHSHALTADATQLLARLERALDQQRADRLRHLLTDLDGPS